MKTPGIMINDPYRDHYRLQFGQAWTVILSRNRTPGLTNLGRNGETWPNFAKWLVWFGRRRG